MFKISVIIPTYKRYQSLNKLLKQLEESEAMLHEVIVVDSTDTYDIQDVYQFSKLKYIHNDKHKNGLFQRYIGFKVSTGDWLVYFDNDMEIISNKFIEIIERISSNNLVSGIAFRIVDKHQETTMATVPTTIIKFKKTRFTRIIRWFTGYPILEPGKFGFNGNRGAHPESGLNTEWLSGGAFACKRDLMFLNYNFQLFSLFEKKLGMGEDALFGFCLSKFGHLIYIHDKLFYHNDQKDSAYSSNHFELAKRVIFSRLYLSAERQRLCNKSILLGYLHYHWYAFWRIFGLLMNLCLDYSISRKNILLGTLTGWIISFGFIFRFSQMDYETWDTETITVLK